MARKTKTKTSKIFLVIHSNLFHFVRNLQKIVDIKIFGGFWVHEIEASGTKAMLYKFCSFKISSLIHYCFSSSFLIFRSVKLRLRDKQKGANSTVNGQRSPSEKTLIIHRKFIVVIIILAASSLIFPQFSLWLL